LLPLQIFADVLVMFIKGIGFTVSVIVAFTVQPETLAAVTVKIVVVIGDTVTILPVNAPGFHV
jgi:hypothetical protein